MKPDRSPIDSVKNPVEDLELAKRLDFSAPPKERAALEREGVGWADAGKRTRRTFSRRTTAILAVAVLIIVLALALSFVLGLL